MSLTGKSGLHGPALTSGAREETGKVIALYGTYFPTPLLRQKVEEYLRSDAVSHVRASMAEPLAMLLAERPELKCAIDAVVDTPSEVPDSFVQEEVTTAQGAIIRFWMNTLLEAREIFRDHSLLPLAKNLLPDVRLETENPARYETWRDTFSEDESALYGALALPQGGVRALLEIFLGHVAHEVEKKGSIQFPEKLELAWRREHFVLQPRNEAKILTLASTTT